MISQNVELLSRKSFPDSAIGSIQTVQTDKVAQLNQEVHLFAPGSIYHRLHTLHTVGHIRCMQIRNNGKTHRLIFFLRKRTQIETEENEKNTFKKVHSLFY